jgi:hypothetical protein
MAGAFEVCVGALRPRRDRRRLFVADDDDAVLAESEDERRVRDRGRHGVNGIEACGCMHGISAHRLAAPGHVAIIARFPAMRSKVLPDPEAVERP